MENLSLADDEDHLFPQDINNGRLEIAVLLHGQNISMIKSIVIQDLTLHQVANVIL